MQFRSVAFITLWTVLSAPVFAPPVKAPAALHERSMGATPREVRPEAPRASDQANLGR